MFDAKLNLLANDRKDDLRSAALLIKVEAILFALLVATALTVFALFSGHLIVHGTRLDYDARSISSSKEYEELMSQVRAINGYLKRTDAARPSVAWSHVLRAATELVPDGIRLSSIQATADGRMTISGTAATRDALLTMKDALEESPLFEEVTSPLSNILQKRDVKFDFELKYAPLAAAQEDKAKQTPTQGGKIK